MNLSVGQGSGRSAFVDETKEVSLTPFQIRVWQFVGSYNRPVTMGDFRADTPWSERDIRAALDKLDIEGWVSSQADDEGNSGWGMTLSGHSEFMRRGLGR